MEIMESIRTALKELILPELDKIREENREIKVRIEMTNKRLDDVNVHLADQSRRIDTVREELSQRIDETNKRMDGMSQKFDSRLDRLYEVIVRRD